MGVDAAVASPIIAGYFCAKPGVAAVYLFGSVARGTAHRESDVDVGVLYDRRPPVSLVGSALTDEAELSERLATEVQVIVMNAAPPDLVHRILRDGLLVLELDKSERIAFEVRARNEYFDLLPTLQEYRRRVGS